MIFSFTSYAANKRDMRTPCAWNDKVPYVANKIPHGSAEPYHDTVRCLYHAPIGAYHEFRKEFYITRRKALYHVALSRETNDTFHVGGDSKKVSKWSKNGGCNPLKSQIPKKKNPL